MYTGEPVMKKGGFKSFRKTRGRTFYYENPVYNITFLKTEIGQYDCLREWKKPTVEIKSPFPTVVTSSEPWILLITP